jgi:transcriptional regulator with XRE-family HTH domain
MPKKNLQREAIPTLIHERLRIWGAAIRRQRGLQRIRAVDLCARMEISEATLRRIERGDPGGGVGLYLMAFQILGVLDELTPNPPAPLWQTDGRQRVRLAPMDADDYF